DFGKKGFEDTCNVLKENGIDYFGVGENENSIDKYRSLTVDGKKVAVYLVAETLFNEPKADYPGANVYDEYLVCKEIEALKKEHDYVLVLYHGGMEFYWYNTDRIRKRFHRMADSGADFVVAQHTHNIGLKEDYNGACLLYGQGNFLFGNNVTEYNKTGLLLEFTFEDGMKIKEHLVRHEGGKAYLDPNPDWSEFEKRNQEYREGNEFRKEYSAYCEHIMLNYIRSFRGINFVDRMVKKFCSDKTYKKFIYRHYTRKHLLRMYSILKCDEHNEIMTTALYDMIQNTKKG
ncbi:MAG: CapA family protein, partial [Erysipelotrichaceae bacterium]|nr:CapA family protein [Erysipelotrichaceae bacterium]